MYSMKKTLQTLLGVAPPILPQLPTNIDNIKVITKYTVKGNLAIIFSYAGNDKDL